MATPTRRASRKEATPKKLLPKDKLTILANGFTDALVFVEGEKGKEKYLFFFPGSTITKGASEERRNNVFTQLLDVMTNPNYLLPTAKMLNKKGFAINEGKRSKKELCCIKTDMNLPAFIKQLDEFDIDFPAAVIPCASLDSPEVPKVIKNYYNHREHALPRELNGVPHEDNTIPFITRVRKTVPNGDKEHRVTISSANGQTKSDKHTPDLLSQELHIENTNRLIFGEWLTKHPSFKEQDTPFARMQQILKKGVIANPGNDKGNLSFFSPKHISPEVFTDILRFALGLEDSQAITLQPVNKRRPAVRGLHQFPLSPDQAEALHEVFDLPILTGGKVSPENIRESSKTSGVQR